MIVVLAFLTAVIGGASALMGVVAARLTVDTRAAWLGSAVGCAVLVVLTESALATSSQSPVLSTFQLLMPCLVVAFLLVALVHPTPVAGWPVASAVSGTVVLVATAGAVSVVIPSSVTALAESMSSRLGLSVAWTTLALAVGVTALARRERALGALAAGIALLGAVHVVDLVGRGPLDAASPVVPFLRLGAVALVLAGSLRLIWRALVRLDAQRDTQEEELRLAMVRLERTAERDHELRTGLAGLAGAARLLGAARSRGDAGGHGPGSPGRPPLDALVASEILRLGNVLSGPEPWTDDEGEAVAYDVEPVLRGLVALRGASGTDVRLEVDAGLRAVGSPGTLAAVMTNVLANAERHAPGSPVRVTAMRWRDRVVVRVRDFGPGIEPGREDAVLERGVRDVARGGSGLGLHVCRRMLAPEHGTITVRSREGARSGCAVVVDLPHPEAEWPAVRFSAPVPECSPAP